MAARRFYIDSREVRLREPTGRVNHFRDFQFAASVPLVGFERSRVRHPAAVRSDPPLPCRSGRAARGAGAETIWGREPRLPSPPPNSGDTS